MIRRPPRSTLFPSTPLFRSRPRWQARVVRRRQHPVHARGAGRPDHRSEEHTSELQSHLNLVCRLLLENIMELSAEAQQRSQRKAAQSDAPLIEQGRYLLVTDEFLCFFNDTAPTEIYTLSLHDALPI